MLAIDTNVIVRYLVRDDPAQAIRAKRLVDTNEIFVCLTVLLETEWVLRSVYGFSAKQCANALRSFAGLPTVSVDNAQVAARTLDWMDRGVAFADGLHLAKAESCEAFISFDREFAAAANALGGTKVRAP
jgi:predicted nucleic-acid-binding protein